MLTVVVIVVHSCSTVAARDSKIIGGEDTVLNEFPHQVSLSMRYIRTECVTCFPGYDLRRRECCLSANPYICVDGDCDEWTHAHPHFCGAALIAPNWVVTAAHCVENKNASLIEAFVGLRDRRDAVWNETYGTNPEAIFMHPNYNTTLFTNDVALIKLGRWVEETDAVKIIPRADGIDGDLAGKKCNESGWGIDMAENVPFILQKTNGTVLSNPGCKEYSIVHQEVINDDHICIHGNHSFNTKGDSGGPLTCTDENGIKILAGVFSFTSLSYYYPDVYTRISYFKEWIDGVMSANP